MTPPVPVVLCVDVEPAGQHRPEASPGPWPGVVAMHEWLAGVRERVEAATGRPAQVTWFLRMDPQIETLFGSATRAADVHRDLVADGDAVGLHIHAWRPAGDGDWIDDLGDADWLDNCLEASFAAYEQAFAEPCRVTRMGYRYLDQRVLAGLARHEVEVDLTPEAARGPVPAGAQPHVTAALPDERRTPRGPQRRIDGGPVILPLSATSRRLGPHPKAWLSKFRHYGWSPLDQPLTLRHEVEPPDTFGARAERSVRDQRFPYLAFALHTGNSDPELLARVDRHLDQLMAGPLAPRLAFTTPQAAWAMLSG